MKQFVTLSVVALAVSFSAAVVLSQSQEQFLPSSEKALLVDSALKASLDLGKIDVNTIAEKLQSGNFRSIESTLNAAFRHYKLDVNWESYIQKSFDLMCEDSGVELAMLDSWVGATQSGMAYAARGIFEAQAGFKARGSKLANQTSDASFVEMVRHHAAASEDLFKAIEKGPAIMPAYAWLIQIAKASSPPFKARDILKAALTQDKRSYYVPLQYITSLQPRWGGSYEAMATFARQAAAESRLNPRLWSLLGEVDGDKGDYGRANAQDLRGAVTLYTSALAFGDRVSWLKYRGICYMYLGQNEKAVADFRKVLYYTPEDTHIEQYLRQAEMALGNK